MYLVYLHYLFLRDSHVSIVYCIGYIRCPCRDTYPNNRDNEIVAVEVPLGHAIISLFCSCCCIPSIRKLCTQYFDENVNGCRQNLIGYGLVAVPRHTCANGHGNGRELYMQNTRKCVEVTQSAFRELNSLTNLAFNLCKRGQT